MTRRIRIIAGALASLAVLAWSCDATTAPSRPQQCAERLGVAYDAEHGATERLGASHACLGGAR